MAMIMESSLGNGGCYILPFPNPTLAILAARIRAAPRSRTQPDQIRAAFSSPPCRSTRAPAIGVPTRLPTPPIVNIIPIRTPIYLRSGEMETTAAGGRDMKAPEKKPYKRTNAMTPLKDSMASQQRTRIPESKIVGNCIFTAPILGD